MKDKGKNIHQKPDDRYPEPLVPAESAWADMQKMLDAEIPQGQTVGKIFSTKLWIIISAAILTATGVGILMMLASGPNVEKHSEKPYTAQNLFNGKTTKNGLSDQNPESKGEPDSSVVPTTINEKAPVKPEVAVKDTALETGSESPQSRTNKQNPDDLAKVKSTIKNDKKSSPINNQRLAPSRVNAFESINEQKTVPKTAVSEHSSKRNSNSSVATENKPDYRSNSENTSLLSSRENRNVPERAPKETVETYSISINPDSNSDVRSKLKNLPRLPSFLVNLLKIRQGNFAQRRNTSQLTAVLVPKPAEVISKKKLTGKDYINGLDFGFQWQGTLPFKNYDRYFTGTNNTNQFYMLLIPGIWVEKQFDRGNGILAKVSPYSQYFGNTQQIATTLTKKSDSVSIATYKKLIKTSGFNAGLRYNQKIYRNWHVGAGFDVQWQQRALLAKETTNFKKDSIGVDTVSYYGIKQTANDSKYLNSFFITGNLELFYAWKNFRIGGTVIAPITSMTTNKAEQKVKPLSGSIFFRWRIK